MFLLLNIFVPSAISNTIIKTEKPSFEESKISSINDGKNCAVFISLGLLGRITFANVAKEGEQYFSNIGYNTQLFTWPFSVLEVKNAIINWIPSNLGNQKQVFIYLVGHSNSRGNQIVGVLQYIRDNNFISWINTMESRCNPSLVTIVIDTCYAGDIINDIKGNKRIIITSTDSDNKSYFSPFQLKLCFSSPFFDSLKDGNSYGKAWEYADKQVDGNNDIQDQNPQINDDYGTYGTSIADTLSPADRLSLRAYPDHIKPKIKTITMLPSILKLFNNIM